MRGKTTIGVIIPALNEEQAIANVITDIPNWVDQIIVVDNGSTDCTVEIAKHLGAHILHEPQQGYGKACLTGITAAKTHDVIVFLDGDYSDYPDEMHKIVDPIVDEDYDLVIGSRALGGAERGALTIPQKFGNWLACSLMWLIWRTNYTDLGPFRAIRTDALQRLNMQDTNYGWTIEMQIKAHKNGLKTCEVPIRYRVRIGTSKISGTIKGTVLAGVKILGTIGKYAIKS